MGGLDHTLKPALEQRRAQSLYRKRKILDSAQSVRCELDGKPVLSFSSNDYLGLANHREVKLAFSEAAERFGVGSGAAHLVNGHSRLHHECEEKLAAFTGRERALLFSTGYMANLAVTAALVDRGDVIFQDKLNHASLIDAARSSLAKFRRYRHNEMEHLDAQLGDSAQLRRRLIMTDAVFSMDGDCAPLPELARLATQHDAWLMVDDAHGFGVLGESGAGLCELHQMDVEEVPILMATLGKAVGVSGAFIAGSEVLIETLIQSARSYIYTTASPPAIAAAVMRSIDLLDEESWRRDRLQDLIRYFCRGARQLDLEVMPSTTAIQPVVIGDNQRALSMSPQLLDEGIHVTAIRPPTVPAGSARLRVTLSAEHQFEDIDRLLDALSRNLHRV